MARTFKSLHGDDVVNTRTMLHEAIPITGTISSGTYVIQGTDVNVKTFSHGMFESVYDYPFLSSSANHIFDVSFGISSFASSSSNTQNAKKLNIYNQMAQVLMGYDVSGNIKNFFSTGVESTTAFQNDLTFGRGSKTPESGSNAGRMDHCYFVNFSRLLTKDEIKKNSFRMQLFTSGTVDSTGAGRGALLTYGDYLSANEFRTSPAGDYALLVTSSTADNSSAGGLLFYQAGVAVLTGAIFRHELGTPAQVVAGTAGTTQAHAGAGDLGGPGSGSTILATGSTIQGLSDAFRHALYDIDFNNTIELNSAIYFCRVNHNDYNYSSNPTYVTGSKLRVKNNINDLPVSYITTVGLYSPDNELLAVAKLSEPIRKDPNTELTLRVRLDY